MKLLVLLTIAGTLAFSPRVQSRFDIRVEADAPENDNENPNGEWVELTSRTTTPIELAGWRLCDMANHCIPFPDGAVAAPSTMVRVLTGAGRDTDTAFYQGSGRAIWNNDGDEARIIDWDGRVVQKRRYGAGD